MDTAKRAAFCHSKHGHYAFAWPLSRLKFPGTVLWCPRLAPSAAGWLFLLLLYAEYE